MFKCDRCGKLDSRSAIDIGLDLEVAEMKCECGGVWRKVERSLCPVCESELEIVPCIDNEEMENFRCPEYPYCPTLGTRRIEHV